MTSSAVVTVVAGRHQHLRRQHVALAESTSRPDLVVVVSMGDPQIAEVVADGPLCDIALVVDVPVDGPSLPVARARNVGAATAIARAAQLLVFLDVDCLPSPELLVRYDEAAGRRDGLNLFCGPVAYLPRLGAGITAYDASTCARAKPHPARPDPPPGTLVQADDMRLFWSLSFAVLDRTWTRIGGFDEAFVGYGAEDTDFGQRARQTGVRMWWVGGALAHHQWHPVSDPPVEHLEDIVRNANLFASRWGWFPMAGWLEAFDRMGLASYDGESWVVQEQSPQPSNSQRPYRGG